VDGSVTALRRHCVIAGRSTARRRVTKHLATYDVIAADLRCRVVDLAFTAALPVFRRRTADRRRATARRTDGNVVAADVGSAVVDCITAAQRVRRDSLLDHSVAAEMSGRVVSGHRAVGAVHHAAVVTVQERVRFAAVHRRAVNARTEGVTVTTDLIVGVIDGRAAAGSTLAVHTTSDCRSVATHLPCSRRQHLIKIFLH